MITVRYFAAARAAAGVPEEQLPATTPAQLVHELSQRHGARLAQVLSISTLLAEGRRLDPTSTAGVPAGAVVDVLPPFAGG